MSKACHGASGRRLGPGGFLKKAIMLLGKFLKRGPASSQSSPVNEGGILFMESRSRADGHGVMIGGGSGEVLLFVLDPGETEALRLGLIVELNQIF